VKTTVNQVVSKRLVKKQLMRWAKQGARQLSQVRTKLLNEERYDTLRCWYAAMLVLSAAATA
jgi:hypothetical protein